MHNPANLFVYTHHVNIPYPLPNYVHPAAQDSDVSSNIWGDQQLQVVLADEVGLGGASKEPAGNEGESHEPGTQHIEAANAIFTDEEWGVKKHGCCVILESVRRIKPFNTKNQVW